MIKRIASVLTGITTVLLTTVGVALTPTTATASEAACPNEALRMERNQSFLPDCRAYEMVSPVDKNGGDVAGERATNIAASDGDGIAFASRAGFAESTGSGAAGLTQYVARRSENGWASYSITPMPAPNSTQALFGSTSIPLFSDDLSRAILWAYDLPAVSTDTPNTVNIYREDTGTGGLEPLTVSRQDPIGPFDFISGAQWGASSDDSHVLLVSATRLLPEAPAGVLSVYDWHNDTLTLASILPDGTPAASGATVEPAFFRGSISQNGSAVAFLSPVEGEPQLYIRFDGARTAWISESEGSVPVPAPVEVTLQAISPDGQHALFTTRSKLLDADTNEGPDLYLYTDSPHPQTDTNLTLLSNTGDVIGNTPGDGTAVAGTNNDASRVFFLSSNNEFFYWDNGNLRLIRSDLPRGDPAKPTMDLGLTESRPGGSRVSASGTKMAFMSDATESFDGIHALTGQVTNGHMEMYVYDGTTDALRCISCPAGPATSDVTVLPGAAGGVVGLGLPYVRPRYFSTDGERIFFSTAESLVARDTNGVTDTYEYEVDTGVLKLVSPGTGGVGVWFADASTSGDDVFLVTRDRLTGMDRDGLADIYDARVGGGLREPTPESSGCVGDACQGLVGAPSTFGDPGSVSFSGSGNTVASSIGKPGVRSLTHAQKLSAALKTCRRKRPGAGRKYCESQARKRYAKKTSMSKGAIRRTK
jgi:hypothetical protein